MIEHKQFSSLTMIAYEGGFYNQAHFIKDFKEFTELNPKQYFSENMTFIKYFTLE
jgi:transcriptional regulator GlxA family with amidase domain